MKIAFLDIPVVALVIFFLISSLFSIDRWASFAGSFLVWHDGFFVFFLQIFWYFFAARFLKLDGIWRFGFILPILFMFFVGVLAKSFAVAFLGLAALLFFHVARKLQGQEKLPQGGEILLIAILFALLGLLGAFPIATLIPLRDSFPGVLASWNVAFSSLFGSAKDFFLGTGPATFSLDMARYGPPIIPSGGSQFAQILATLGVLGFLLYLLVFILTFLRFTFLVFSPYGGSPVGRQKHDRTQAFLGASLFAVFSAYLFSLATLPLLFLFWTLAGLTREKTHVIPKITKPFWKLGVILVAGFVSLWGFRVFAGAIVFQKARTETRMTNQISFLETAKKLNPYEAAYKIELGKLYLNQAKLENALLNLREATIVSPARPHAWEALGIFYKEIQGAPGAKEWGVKAFETALTLSPKNPRLYTELGMLYTQKEEFLLAEEYFQKALAIAPGFIDARLALALVEEKRGNVDVALSSLEKVSGENPTQPEIRFQLGRIYYNAGRLTEAETTFKQVLLLNPNNSNAHYALGVLYEKEKRKKEAIQEFQKVLELNPGDSNVILKLNQLKNK